MKKINFLTIILFFLTLPILAQEKDHSQIAELYGDAIVSVNVIKKDASTYSGTGFIIDTNGIIVTAAHVIKDALAVNFTFKNGVISEEAKILAVTKDDTIDLALLQIPNENLPYVILGDSNQVKAGEEITVIGNPRRLQNTITNGLISQIRQVSPTVIWHQISAPISPSSSGSPVFNKKGEVIAIATSSLKGKENQNINFAIPSNYLKQLMAEKNIYLAEDFAPIVKEQPTFFEKVKNYIKRAWNISKKLVSSIFN
jgi:Trypsin-like serine proteases, typically periplasmic, contain C-terminal PDZ domain